MLRKQGNMNNTIQFNKLTTLNSYQATAQQFADNVADLSPVGSIEKLMSLLLPNPRVIDIGCGSGRDAKIFHSLGAQVVGIDFCPNLLEIAKKQAPDVDFQLMDIESLDFPDSSFDAAWAACSLVHLAKHSLPSVLSKIYDILDDDGYFYLSIKQGTNEVLEKDERYEGEVIKFWSYYQADELKTLLETAGFSILAFDLIEKSHHYQTHPAYRIFCKKN